MLGGALVCAASCKESMLAAHGFNADFVLDHLCIQDHVVVLELRAVGARALCPTCSHHATRVHSTYLRTLADLSWQGMPVRLHVRIRRFRCDHPPCPRTTFAERIDSLALPYARRTTRLAAAVTRVGILLGGQAGARLLPIFGVVTSADTVLRMIHRAPLPPSLPPRVVGIDDWAKRRGHSYGSIVVDLERHAVIDLLPDRTAETFTRWLSSHPGVEVVARDRAEAYAEGARQGAPTAVQVADRWHLLKNLGELLERILHRYRAALAQAAAAASAATIPALPMNTTGVPMSVKDVPSVVPSSVRTVYRIDRQAWYDQIHALRAQGFSHAVISARVGVSPATVRKYLHATTCPTRASRRTKIGTLTKFDAHLRARWQQGDRDAVVLWRELQEHGFHGSVRAVQRHVARWQGPDEPHDRRRRAKPTPHAPRSVATRAASRPPSPRQVRWWLVLPKTRLTEDQRRYVAHLTQDCPSLGAAQRLAVEFGRLLRTKDVGALASWLTQAATSEHAEFREFAAGLKRDQAAMEAAVRERWSNGQTEGQVTKLKMLKRQMYGRASLGLLRQRLLAAA